MLTFLLYRILCALLGLVVRVGVEDRDVEIAVLRHQLWILSRRGRRPDFTTADRAFFAAASRFLPRERWSAFPVAPDTLSRWRRQLRSRRRLSRRRGPGRPPIDLAVRELILRMARENPRWGYLRIKGELIKLGITVSATTIANVLRRDGLGPAPRRIGPTWAQFLRAQALAIVATGAPGSGSAGDRGGQEQVRTVPATMGKNDPSLEEEWCPSEAPAAPIRDPEQGWRWPHVLRLDRPSRMKSVCLSPISGVNARDGPAAARLRLADWRDRGTPAGSLTRIAAESGVPPVSPARGRSWLAGDRRIGVIAKFGGAGRSSFCTQQVDGHTFGLGAKLSGGLNMPPVNTGATCDGCES